MKLYITILFICLGMLFSHNALADETTLPRLDNLTGIATESYFTNDICTREISCAICGATVIEEVEETKYGDSCGVWGVYTRHYNYPEARILDYDSPELKVCPDCLEQFRGEFESEMSALWESLVKEAVDKRARQRQENYMKQKVRRLEELKEQLRDIRKEMESLKEPEPTKIKKEG